ncbi:uncharacterized protein ASCRUDRAFT_75134 [Ascoidea rubescens DSM 1968]|uniref:Uncharacterized protein n=1 Tax=Ascoidea rubescens DSM 1968 TaxID=1344418 RepID=A0A1D2VJR9_9ASCO|nr:hypothetical protein ASCRUDRAFT_75134 [Ascoidea rubescens DSM 1968]ODV61866.1 hypothetical protein ASCRUDRAFT_75134 [Ascoidea rubescens DSM 1968]
MNVSFCNFRAPFNSYHTTFNTNRTRKKGKPRTRKELAEFIDISSCISKTIRPVSHQNNLEASIQDSVESPLPVQRNITEPLLSKNSLSSKTQIIFKLPILPPPSPSAKAAEEVQIPKLPSKNFPLKISSVQNTQNTQNTQNIENDQNQSNNSNQAFKPSIKLDSCQKNLSKTDINTQSMLNNQKSSSLPVFTIKSTLPNAEPIKKSKRCNSDETSNDSSVLELNSSPIKRSRKQHDHNLNIINSSIDSKKVLNFYSSPIKPSKSIDTNDLIQKPKLRLFKKVSKRVIFSNNTFSFKNQETNISEKGVLRNKSPLKSILKPSLKPPVFKNKSKIGNPNANILNSTNSNSFNSEAITSVASKPSIDLLTDDQEDQRDFSNENYWQPGVIFEPKDYKINNVKILIKGCLKVLFNEKSERKFEIYATLNTLLKKTKQPVIVQALKNRSSAIIQFIKRDFVLAEKDIFKFLNLDEFVFDSLCSNLSTGDSDTALVRKSHTYLSLNKSLNSVFFKQTSISENPSSSQITKISNDPFLIRIYVQILKLFSFFCSKPEMLSSDDFNDIAFILDHICDIISYSNSISSSFISKTISSTYMQLFKDLKILGNNLNSSNYKVSKTTLSSSVTNVNTGSSLKVSTSNNQLSLELSERLLLNLLNLPVGKSVSLIIEKILAIKNFVLIFPNMMIKNIQFYFKFLIINLFDLNGIMYLRVLLALNLCFMEMSRVFIDSNVTSFYIFRTLNNLVSSDMLEILQEKQKLTQSSTGVDSYVGPDVLSEADPNKKHIFLGLIIQQLLILILKRAHKLAMDIWCSLTLLMNVNNFDSMQKSVMRVSSFDDWNNLLNWANVFTSCINETNLEAKSAAIKSWRCMIYINGNYSNFNVTSSNNNNRMMLQTRSKSFSNTSSPSKNSGSFSIDIYHKRLTIMNYPFTSLAVFSNLSNETRDLIHNIFLLNVYSVINPVSSSLLLSLKYLLPLWNILVEPVLMQFVDQKSPIFSVMFAIKFISRIIQTSSSSMHSNLDPLRVLGSFPLSIDEIVSFPSKWVYANNGKIFNILMPIFQNKHIYFSSKLILLFSFTNSLKSILKKEKEISDISASITENIINLLRLTFGSDSMFVQCEKKINLKLDMAKKIIVTLLDTYLISSLSDNSLNYNAIQKMFEYFIQYFPTYLNDLLKSCVNLLSLEKQIKLFERLVRIDNIDINKFIIANLETKIFDRKLEFSDFASIGLIFSSLQSNVAIINFFNYVLRFYEKRKISKIVLALNLNKWEPNDFINILEMLDKYYFLKPLIPDLIIRKFQDFEVEYSLFILKNVILNHPLTYDIRDIILKHISEESNDFALPNIIYQLQEFFVKLLNELRLEPKTFILDYFLSQGLCSSRFAVVSEKFILDAPEILDSLPLSKKRFLKRLSRESAESVDGISNTISNNIDGISPNFAKETKSSDDLKPNTEVTLLLSIVENVVKLDESKLIYASNNQQNQNAKEQITCPTNAKDRSDLEQDEMDEVSNKTEVEILKESQKQINLISNLESPLQVPDNNFSQSSTSNVFENHFDNKNELVIKESLVNNQEHEKNIAQSSSNSAGIAKTTEMEFILNKNIEHFLNDKPVSSEKINNPVSRVLDQDKNTDDRVLKHNNYMVNTADVGKMTSSRVMRKRHANVPSNCRESSVPSINASNDHGNVRLLNSTTFSQRLSSFYKPNETTLIIEIESDDEDDEEYDQEEDSGNNEKDTDEFKEQSTSCDEKNDNEYLDDLSSEVPVLVEGHLSEIENNNNDIHQEMVGKPDYSKKNGTECLNNNNGDNKTKTEDLKQEKNNNLELIIGNGRKDSNDDFLQNKKQRFYSKYFEEADYHKVNKKRKKSKVNGRLDNDPFIGLKEKITGVLKGISDEDISSLSKEEKFDLDTELLNFSRRLRNS